MTESIAQVGAYIEYEEEVIVIAQVGAYIEYEEEVIVIAQVGAYIEYEEPEEEDKFGPKIQIV